MKRIVLTGIFFLAISPLLLAQPLGPNSPVPFGGVELLMAAGALYGAQRAYKKKKISNK